jgi:transcriptional regulator with XRE-family HTH domain
MDIKKMVGMRINSALARSGMLQKDLAKVLGVTDNTISYYCNGARSPQLEQLPTIAKALNTTVDYLLGITADPDIQKSATDDLGLSPTVIKKIKSLKDMWPSSCDYLHKTNRLLENNDIWELLFLIDSLHTATRVDTIFSEVLSQEKVICDVRQRLLDMAAPFYDVDSDLYYFLQYRAHSLSADDTAVSFESGYLTMEELQTARINRMLMAILFDISRGDKDGID